MIETSLYNLFLNFGFSALVTGFVLIRLDKTINDNTKAINSLKNLIIRQKNKNKICK